MHTEIEFYTVRELAERYRCSLVTIRRWCSGGSFPQPIRLGRRTLLWPAATVLRA